MLEGDRLSPAEKLEQKLVRNGKPIGDISTSEMNTLLEHPILAGRVKDIEDGSHLKVVQFPEARFFIEGKLDYDDFDRDGVPKYFSQAILRHAHHDIVYKNNQVFKPYVVKVLSIIWFLRNWDG